MVLQSRIFGCVWKPGFVKSVHKYCHCRWSDSYPEDDKNLAKMFLMAGLQVTAPC